MTAIRRDGNESAFSSWIRKHPELDSRGGSLSVTDCDFWVHRYSPRPQRTRGLPSDVREIVDHIMLVELKTFGRDEPFSQRDTLTIVNALLRRSCMLPTGRRRHIKIDDTRISWRQQRAVRCFGVHLLQLSSDRPDTSDAILWDKKPINERVLIDLLLFKLDPDSPSSHLDTRLHHVQKPQPTLRLFVDDSNHEDDAA